jgi:hypothetical protein
MQRYEFKVVPAPRKDEKLRGVKTVEERFAQSLTTLMNQMGRDGWDYVRADTLPVDERAGFTGTKTSFQYLLVFRRPLDEAAALSASLLAKPEEVKSLPRLGPAEPPAGPAPALGPASTDVAAE